MSLEKPIVIFYEELKTDTLITRSLSARDLHLSLCSKGINVKRLCLVVKFNTSFPKQNITSHHVIPTRITIPSSISYCFSNILMYDTEKEKYRVCKVDPMYEGRLFELISEKIALGC